MISKILPLFSIIGVVNSQCQMRHTAPRCEHHISCQAQQHLQQQQQQQQQQKQQQEKEKEQEPFVDPWALKTDEIVYYDLLPLNLYTALYDTQGISPGCPGGQTEDDCIRMLGCSWCPWNNLGCVYKDVADLLPIPYIEGESGEDFYYSATSIGGGEPEEYHWFWFYYGRFYPPVVTR